MSKLFKILTLSNICNLIILILSFIGLLVVMLVVAAIISNMFDKPKGFDDTIIKQIDHRFYLNSQTVIQL